MEIFFFPSNFQSHVDSFKDESYFSPASNQTATANRMTEKLPNWIPILCLECFLECCSNFITSLISSRMIDADRYKSDNRGWPEKPETDWCEMKQTKCNVLTWVHTAVRLLDASEDWNNNTRELVFFDSLIACLQNEQHLNSRWLKCSCAVKVTNKFWSVRFDATLERRRR